MKIKLSIIKNVKIFFLVKVAEKAETFIQNTVKLKERERERRMHVTILTRFPKEYYKIMSR